jgi:hypothetical protein
MGDKMTGISPITGADVESIVEIEGMVVMDDTAAIGGGDDSSEGSGHVKCPNRKIPSFLLHFN